jgi:hypothetical protein
MEKLNKFFKLMWKYNRFKIIYFHSMFAIAFYFLLLPENIEDWYRLYSAIYFPIFIPIILFIMFWIGSYISLNNKKLLDE